MDPTRLTSSSIYKKSDLLWEIPKTFRSDMRVPARIYATELLLADMLHDRSLEQLVNVTTLPGIVEAAYVMPDAHEGYGFPVGGVAAFDPLEGGIISPGGIGYDINCGVRLLKTPLLVKDVQGHSGKLGKFLYQEIPSGVGRGGNIDLATGDLDQILKFGAQKIVDLGFGFSKDIDHIESGGVINDASPDLVSQIAKKRGHDQLGTMGAGNHFVEVDLVDEVFDLKTATHLGLKLNQIVVLIHTGSRGLGHQVATDYIRTMIACQAKYGLNLVDRELACAPVRSPEGQDYWRAMAAAANFAWSNRQMITHEVRLAFLKTFNLPPEAIEVVYDVAHNIAKIETYQIKRRQKELVVHRKGATRSFPGQPVLIPGSMGTASYVLIGQEASLSQSFGSCCHGAGRRLSRTEAKRQVKGKVLRHELESRGIIVDTGSTSGLAEEAPLAYKDVTQVVDVIHSAGLAKKVSKLRPLVVVKG